MKTSFVRVRARLQAFARENPILLVMFFFLLFAGMVAGMHLMEKNSGATVNAISDYIHINGVSWVYCVLMSVCMHGVVAAMLLLCTLFLPAAPLWPIAILLRGVLTGVYMGLVRTAWPQKIAVCLMLLLLANIALMLPAFLKLSAIAKRRLAISGMRVLNKKEGKETLQQDIKEFLRACAGFLPCILLESVVAPLAIYIFC